MITLPKSVRRERLIENADVGNFKIVETDMTALDNLDENLITDWYVLWRTGQCLQVANLQSQGPYRRTLSFLVMNMTDPDGRPKDRGFSLFYLLS